jgi:hypothetical protein
LGFLVNEDKEGLMMKKLKELSVYLLCMTTLIFLASCGGGGSSVDGQGTLSTSLTDSSSEDYKAVYVTIDRVDVHLEENDSWETVATPGGTYNLLELVNGVVENLGEVVLDSGHYTQMRLIIGETPDQSLNIFDQQHDYANYIIDQDDVAHELTVPSGSQTGLKVVNGFDINDNQTTELILDFDALRSVVKAGSSGKYLLKPTIKVLTTTDYGIVDGTVTAAGLALEKVFVTAQTTEPLAADIKDQVVIQSGTLTTEAGEYALFLEPGDYNLVATRTGYLPVCTTVSLGEDSTNTVDFSLSLLEETSLSGNLSGRVTIAGAVDDQHVTIDFRQQMDCSGASQMVIVKTVEIADGGQYSVDLTPGEDYHVVATTYGKETFTAEQVAVTSDDTAELNISFE